MQRQVRWSRRTSPFPSSFEQGGYAELGFTLASPEVRGTDILGTGTGNVGRDYSMGSLGLKLDLTDSISAALVVDQPFGISVAYGPASPVFAGTTGQMDSTAVTALLRYRLDGYDENWIETSQRRSAWYTNLPPRQYRFRVMAYTYDGSWPREEAALEVNLQPRFYERAWFYAGAAALLAALALAATGSG